MAVSPEARPGKLAPLRARLGPGRASRSPDARDLEYALRRSIAGEVRFDGGTRALYATDLSIYRQVPIGVVIPRHADDVIATVSVCRERGVPILARGCGTSLSGQTCNVAVVIDFSKYMNRLLELDPEHRLARIEPGLINDQLRTAAEQHQLTFAPDPATHAYCTLGGNIGNNSCGAHTVMGGKTVDNVETLDVLTYDGLRLRVGATSDSELDQIRRGGGRRAQIYAALQQLAQTYAPQIRQRYPHIPRRVSGYNLDDLLPEKGFHVARALVGSESTCALTLSATVRLIESPRARALIVLAYDDVARGADEVGEIRVLRPIALEGFERHVVTNMLRKGRHPRGVTLLPEAGAYLLVEFGGENAAAATAAARHAVTALRLAGTAAREVCVFEQAADQEDIWHVRESGVGASRVPGEEEAWPSWEDAAVPPQRLGAYLREFEQLNRRFGYRSTLFGHFGDGCVHARMTFGLRTHEGIRKFRAYMQEAADLCLAYGGSLSGEHGDGQAKGELLPKMFGPELMQAFRDFKTIWDPSWRMNPGKLIDAQPLDANLRLGESYRPAPVVTRFRLQEDGGSFAHAAERCFGVGKCRALGGQTMCPSFQATREERYSTRGRAHLLFEMMRGETIRDGWRSEAVREALDLCLQCKGCKHDCPVSVDMATYKAEFLSHHYAHRLRPRAAYSMGLIFLWSRVAMLAPGLVNSALSAPLLGRAIKWLAGFTPARAAPAYAAESFQSWWGRRRTPRSQDASLPQVILWPDTFSNYFLPGTLKAAVTVLEDAGYRIHVPQGPLCCGRPLYDYGMLSLARTKLQQILTQLRPLIRSGVPLVALEPSCLSVFRDEMKDLLADDEDAQRLASQAKTVSELLLQTPGWRPPRLERRALVHLHCHHKAVLNADATLALLRQMGLQIEQPAPGCCGHAGSFGYEVQHHGVSMQIAELALLPAVRQIATDRLIIADGFSCRQQIRDGASRWAMHPVELLALALQTRDTLPQSLPERRYLEPAARPSIASTLLAGGVALAAGVALGRMSRRLWR